MAQFKITAPNSYAVGIIIYSLCSDHNGNLTIQTLLIMFSKYNSSFMAKIHFYTKS